MYFYNSSNGTAFLKEDGDAGGATVEKFQEPVVGLLPSMITKLSFPQDAVIIHSTSSYTFNGVRKVYNHSIEIYKDAEGELFANQFNGINEMFFLTNKQLYVANGTIEAARLNFTMPSTATADEVIKAMATQTWKMRFDKPELNSTNTSIDIIVENISEDTCEVKLSTIVNGEIYLTPRNHIEVWPTTPVLGLPSNASNDKCGAQFPYGRQFILSTNLRNREAYQMLGGGPYKVRVWSTVKRANGDSYSIYAEKIIPLKDTNPLLEG
jgi:hypothetical protein